MIKILEAPLDNDLHALSVYWWQLNIAHKIAEEAGRQVIWADTDQHAQRMNDDYKAFCDGRLQLTLEKKPKTNSLAPLTRLVIASPVTLSLIFLSMSALCPGLQ